MRRVYGNGLEAMLRSLASPPLRYYVRVNRLKADVGEVLDTLRGLGYEVYLDEDIGEAVWFPVRGPERLPTDVDCVVRVDKYAAESVMLGADLYAPGIVEAPPCMRPGVEVLIAYGDRVVGYGVAVRSADDVSEGKKGLAVRVVKPLYRVPSLRGLGLHASGVLYEQSYPSMVAVKLLDPREGEIVVDMCAAPGGKTGYIYELAGGKVKLYAFDHSKRKIERMREELQRLGHTSVRIIRADSRYLDKDFPQLVGKVDKVLLDPPCSSIGVVPKIDDEKRYKDILNLAEYQKQFIKTAWKLLKTGGILVYSTCTVTLEENEDVVKWALDHGFELVDIYPSYRGARGVGLDSCLRFHPHVQRLGGFFIAVLRKTRS